MLIPLQPFSLCFFRGCFLFFCQDIRQEIEQDQNDQDAASHRNAQRCFDINAEITQQRNPEHDPAHHMVKGHRRAVRRMVGISLGGNLLRLLIYIDNPVCDQRTAAHLIGDDIARLQRIGAALLHVDSCPHRNVGLHTAA